MGMGGKGRRVHFNDEASLPIQSQPSLHTALSVVHQLFDAHKNGSEFLLRSLRRARRKSMCETLRCIHPPRDEKLRKADRTAVFFASP